MPKQGKGTTIGKGSKTGKGSRTGSGTKKNSKSKDLDINDIDELVVGQISKDELKEMSQLTSNGHLKDSAPVEAIAGIGKAKSKKLHEEGFNEIKDIKNHSIENSSEIKSPPQKNNNLEIKIPYNSSSNQFVAEIIDYDKNTNKFKRNYINLQHNDIHQITETEKLPGYEENSNNTHFVKYHNFLKIPIDNPGIYQYKDTKGYFKFLDVKKDGSTKELTKEEAIKRLSKDILEVNKDNNNINPAKNNNSENISAYDKDFGEKKETNNLIDDQTKQEIQKPEIYNKIIVLRQTIDDLPRNKKDRLQLELLDVNGEPVVKLTNIDHHEVEYFDPITSSPNKIVEKIEELSSIKDITERREEFIHYLYSSDFLEWKSLDELKKGPEKGNPFTEEIPQIEPGDSIEFLNDYNHEIEYIKPDNKKNSTKIPFKKGEIKKLNYSTPLYERLLREGRVKLIKQSPEEKNRKIKEAESVKITFGKYKGKTLGEIKESDPGYVKWLAQNAYQSDLRDKAELLQ